MKMIAELNWMLVPENRRKTARHEQRLESPDFVYSIKRSDDGDGYYIKMWNSDSTLITVGVEAKYVGEVLTEEAYKKVNESNEFVTLGTYERSYNLETTHFCSVRMNSAESFTLRDMHGTTVDVSAEWAKSHYRAHVIVQATKNFQDWVPLGEGSSGFDCIVPEELRGPPVMYRNDEEGTLCLPMAAANGLHYAGFEKAARLIAKSAAKVVSTPDPWKALKDLVEKAIVNSGEGKRIRFWKGKYGNGLDGKLPCDHLVLAKPACQRNGKETNINHYVCFFGGFVFDSNLDFAMIISRSSMDIVCQNIVAGSTYLKILRSSRIEVS